MSPRTRPSTRRLALAGALLLAPALASAQPYTSYQFGNGTLRLGGPFSADRCGQLFCLNLEAGAGGDGILVRAVGARSTAAFAQTGALTFDYVIRSSVGVISCNPLLYGGNGCRGESGGFPLSGHTYAPFPSLSYGVPVLAYGTINSYSVFVPATVNFTAYDAAGRVVASDQFVPSIFVTPEPATLALTLGGLAVLGAGAWRRQRA